MSGNKYYLLLETSLWRLSHTICLTVFRQEALHMRRQAAGWSTCWGPYYQSIPSTCCSEWRSPTLCLGHIERENKRQNWETEGVIWAEASNPWPFFSFHLEERKWEDSKRGGGKGHPFIAHLNFPIYKIDTIIIPFYTPNEEGSHLSASVVSNGMDPMGFQPFWLQTPFLWKPDSYQALLLRKLPN